jgi:predicted amidohydrolase YtcJ
VALVHLIPRHRQSCGINNSISPDSAIRVSLLVLMLAGGLLGQTARVADLVVINAKVRTMTSQTSVAEAIAVTGNRITTVGSNTSIRKLVGPSTRVIDARSRLVLPGFNDSHVHFMAIGNTFSSIDLRTLSRSQVTYHIARYARFLPKGRWILGGHFSRDVALDRAAIDAVTKDNPVFLFSSDTSVAFANTAAFLLAGFGRGSPDVDRSPTGAPTGMIRNAALIKLRNLVPRDHMANWPEIAETATNYAAFLGVTSVQDMHSDDRRSVYRDLELRGKLRTRVYDCMAVRDTEKLRSSRLLNAPGDLVTDGCIKSFSDGDEDAAAALLRDVVAADKSGFQIAVHAIGNSANRIVLDVFERAVSSNGRRDRRFRVEHAHNASEADVRRFKGLEVIASMQPFLFEGSNGSKYGSLLREGAHVAFGSDASMVDLNPLLGIHAAVNAGSEAITVYDAVSAYTTGSAYAEFRENEKGTIEPDKLADFVVLSDDIFSVDRMKIRDAKVILTVVNGQIVFQAN